MRCPKCGYTSFDNLERCKRCKKNIAATAAALMGTTVDAIPPFFLMPKEADDTSATPAAAGSGASISLNKGAAAAVSPTNETVALDEVPALPESKAAPAAPDPSLDLSGVDISDLKAPAAETQAAAGPPVDDFSLEDLQLGDDELAAPPKAAPAARPAPAPPKPGGKVSPAAKTGTALDSFNFDDLDELLVADEKA